MKDKKSPPLYIHGCEHVMQSGLHQSASNYVSVKLRDDARNSSNDKLFRVHHPKSRNLGAVTVHFLLCIQISPVNWKRGSEETLCHSLTQLRCGHSLQELIRDVCVDMQTQFHIHLKFVPPELQSHMKMLTCGS